MNNTAEIQVFFSLTIVLKKCAESLIQSNILTSKSNKKGILGLTGRLCQLKDISLKKSKTK